MGYFDDEEKVAQYVEMAEGYDGRELMPILARHLPKGSSLLELGMGPGKDYRLLSEYYEVTGSDNSQVFLDRYRRLDPSADLMWLDAVSMETKRTFDGIYSNKVLQHLSRPELIDSLERQWLVLSECGVLFHTFWYGEGKEMLDGLRFVYYTEVSFGVVLGSRYELIEFGRYAEMKEEDSIYFVARKKSK